jgi:hypothetical protein
VISRSENRKIWRQEIIANARERWCRTCKRKLNKKPAPILKRVKRRLVEIKPNFRQSQ